MQTQPFILAFGDAIHPEQQFVIVERVAIEATSLLAAVDICLKTFYVMDMDYPWQCANTWDFLQKIVYGLGAGKGREGSTADVLSLKNFLFRNYRKEL